MERLRKQALELLERRREDEHARLAKARAHQKKAFDALKGDFAARVRSLERFDESAFLTEEWARAGRYLRGKMLPVPPFSFLNDYVIKTAMVPRVDDPTAMLARARARFKPRRLAELLTEDWVGVPPWPLFEIMSSSTQLRHLNDLLHFSDVAGCRVDRLKTVVEWGGGYGGMAKVFRRWRRGSTYVLIDISLMNCLQWLYLATVFGEDSVHQLQTPDAEIRKGRINLVPLGLLDRLDGFKADLFISTFALSESAPLAQERVFNADWWGAKHLLVAYDSRRYETTRLRRALKRRGARVERTVVGDGSYYALL
jgi:hypothetical protein